MVFLCLNLILVLLSCISIINIKKIPSYFVIYDYPDSNRKIHSIPTPLFGGIIFYINIIFYLIILEYDNNLNLKLLSLLIILFSCFFILGFLDDKYSLSPVKKTFFIVLVLILVLPFENKLVLESLIFKDISLSIGLGKFNILFTLFCIYLFYNFLNFTDGANGITISLCIFWTIIFLTFGSIEKFLLLSILISLLTLFFFNLKNKIFLGNSGTSLLSIVFGIFFIFNYNIDKSIKCDEIFLLMFIPSIDALRVIVERIINKKSPFNSDKRHLHHLLLKKFSIKFVIIPYFILSVLPYVTSLYINTIVSFAMYLIVYSLIFLKLNKI